MKIEIQHYQLTNVFIKLNHKDLINSTTRDCSNTYIRLFMIFNLEMLVL